MTDDTPDPMRFIAQLDAEMEAVQMACRYCALQVEVIDAGKRFVIGFTHERGCPDYVDVD
jgi:hypothetical protein